MADTQAQKTCGKPWKIGEKLYEQQSTAASERFNDYNARSKKHSQFSLPILLRLTDLFSNTGF